MKTVRIAHWSRMIGLAGISAQLWARSDATQGLSRIWAPLEDLGLERVGWSVVITAALVFIIVLDRVHRKAAALAGIAVYTGLGAMWLAAAPLANAGILALTIALGSAAREMWGDR